MKYIKLFEQFLNEGIFDDVHYEKDEVNCKKFQKEAQEKGLSGNEFFQYVIDKYINNSKFMQEFENDVKNQWEAGEVEDFFKYYNRKPYYLIDDYIDALMAYLEDKTKKN